MKALVLAAGRGERLRPLTDRVPKPLVPVAGRPLLAWHLHALAAAGFEEAIINLSHLGARIQDFAGDGSAFGIPVRYSDEGEQALDTGGGIRHALPLLGEAPFAVINADVFSDFPLASLRARAPEAAHLVLVDNPPHHPDGDFFLCHDEVRTTGTRRLTFAGIGVYQPRIFADVSRRIFALGQVLHAHVPAGAVSGEHYRGMWVDVGTPHRLAEAETAAQSRG